MKKHPLTLRILATLGLTTTSTLLAGTSVVASTANCCPPYEDTGPYDATINAQCTIHLESSLDHLYERCVALELTSCPPFDQIDSLPSGAAPVCGPFPPSNGSTSSSASASTSASTSASSTTTTTSSSTSTSTTSSSSGAGAGGDGGAGGGAPRPTITCCYGVIESGPYGGGCGRPFVVAGVAVTAPVIERGDWARRRGTGASDTLESPSPSIAALLADRFAADAALEHASVASFARFVLDLLAVGAPSALVTAATRAMGDEIDHAERCFVIASRWAGRAVGPAAFPGGGAPFGGSLVEVALRALEEGCIGETIAAVVAARTLERTVDPEARAALSVIARDEAAHAELAYRFVAWASRDASVRDALRARAPSALAVAQASVFDPATDALEPFGQPGDRLRALAVAEAIELVARPCIEAALATLPASYTEPRGSLAEGEPGELGAGGVYSTSV